MSTLLLIFAAALVFAIGATPIAKRIALHTGVVDQPSARKIHTRPVPLLGGAAIYGAFMIALFLFADRFYVSQIVGIVIGATWVSLLGFWDDRVGLGVGLKMAGQILGALILIATGVAVNLFLEPWANALVTLVWIVGITNALNLLDNMDGLAGGVAAIAAAFFLLIAVLNGQYFVSALAAALLGASIGFLTHNLNPASIFMGDTGSLFLGFVLAALGIKLRFPDNTYLVTWMVPVLVLGLPIFDTTLVVLSRLRHHAPIFLGAKDHLSHRLVARGFTAREAVMAHYLVAGALGVAAMFVMLSNALEAYAAAAMLGLGALAALWKFEFS